MPADIGPLATGDIDVWCAIIAEGRARESGSTVDAGALAAALFDGDTSTEDVLRLSARRDGLVVGVADCRTGAAVCGTGDRVSQYCFRAVGQCVALGPLSGGPKRSRLCRRRERGD